MYKKILSICILLGLFLTPIFSSAHVKWFTKIGPQKASIEEILSPLFLAVTVGVAIILAILTQILPKLMELTFAKKIDTKLDEFRKYSRTILKYGTAISLIVQVLNGALFAPEFHLDEEIITIAVWAAIALLCIPNHTATKAASVILLVLFGSSVVEYGLFHMLDYGFYVAIFVVLLLEKTKYTQKIMPFLYLGTGLSLCWVAVEKWVYPAMSVDIIQNHHVPTFGFAPATFIVLSAFIEFVVGYLLVVGILNRLLALVLTGLFILTTTVFGSLEVVGHLMIHVLLIIFIIEGVSFYHPPVKIHKTKTDQMIFVFLNFIFVLATFLLLYYRFA